MVNKTILQGRLVRDVETRVTDSGVTVASFTVAWSETYKEKETQCFLPCTAWRNTAEFVGKYFSKGQEIVVEGSLSTRKWTDKEGNNRSTTELTVDKAHFCGPKRSNSDSNCDESQLPDAASAPMEPLDGDDGDLPF